MENQDLTDVRWYRPDLGRHDSDAQASGPEHEAELVFETNNDCFIKIFFDPKESLDLN